MSSKDFFPSSASPLMSQLLPIGISALLVIWLIETVVFLLSYRQTKSS
jgi:hypothetical protein